TSAKPRRAAGATPNFGCGTSGVFYYLSASIAGTTAPGLILYWILKTGNGAASHPEVACLLYATGLPLSPYSAFFTAFLLFTFIPSLARHWIRHVLARAMDTAADGALARPGARVLALNARRGTYATSWAQHMAQASAADRSPSGQAPLLSSAIAGPQQAGEIILADSWGSTHCTESRQWPVENCLREREAFYAAHPAEVAAYPDCTLLRTDWQTLALDDNSVDSVAFTFPYHLSYLQSAEDSPARRQAKLDMLLAEVQRVLRPGGILTVCVLMWQSNRVDRVTATLIRREASFEGDEGQEPEDSTRKSVDEHILPSHGPGSAQDTIVIPGGAGVQPDCGWEPALPQDTITITYSHVALRVGLFSLTLIMYCAAAAFIVINYDATAIPADATYDDTVGNQLLSNIVTMPFSFALVYYTMLQTCTHVSGAGAGAVREVASVQEVGLAWFRGNVVGLRTIVGYVVPIVLVTVVIR
ncbi:unnamed protein product, partial [Symbiodinium sp. KB8]